MLTLLVLQGPDKGRRFELPDEKTLIGRESRQLPLTDNTVSRRHAELIPADGNWILHDMGSSNGSYVNGARVEENFSLKLGDQIRVGRTLLVFGSQPGISRGSGGNVSLSGIESGMDSAIMHTVASNDDSMVLAVPEPAAAAMTNLKILYQLGAALGSSFGIDQIMDVVMDLVFEHVKADRGMILLLNEKNNELIPTVVRTRDQHEAEKDQPEEPPAADATPESPAAPGSEAAPKKPKEEKFHASRTIIHHVLNTGEGVLSSNAMTDKRFSRGKSVQNLGIRSALCVPIKARKLGGKTQDQIVGLIYIDSSVSNYSYAPDQLRLLTAIGLQAGMAVSNALLFQAGLKAERMVAVGETTAALSHSIKNILQALRGGADVVEMGLKAQNLPQATKGWRIVERNLDKIYSLTMNLLAYSKPREPKLEQINPRVIINDCLELIAARATEKGVMAVADVEPDTPAIPADPDGLHQVLMNLLSNAIDAVETNKGLIRVICRYDGENRQCIIQVIDNGAGVPPSMMEHMFEIFHSTKGNRGTGLGLAVAKKIVEEHDGSIIVKSRQNEGTQFTIRLPVFHTTLSDPSHTHGPAR